MSSSHTIKADSFRVSTDGRTNDLEISKGSESVLKGNWKVDGSLKVEQGTDPKSPVTVSHLGEKLSELKVTVDNEVADTYVNKTEWNSKNEDLKGYTDNSVTGLSDSLPSTYVTLDTAQRVTGLKTFEGGFNIYYADKNTNKLSWKYDSDGIKILGGENFSQNISFKLEPYQLKIGTITVWQLKSLGGDINQSITLPSKSGVVALVSDVDAVSDSLEILDITVGEISNNLDALSLVVADTQSDISSLNNELSVVKSDVGNRYTKHETDAQLAVKADKAEVEAEAQARQEADAALGERVDANEESVADEFAKMRRVMSEIGEVIWFTLTIPEDDGTHERWITDDGTHERDNNPPTFCRYYDAQTWLLTTTDGGVATIDWGGGTVESFSGAAMLELCHKYTVAGKYEFTAKGGINTLGFTLTGNYLPNATIRERMSDMSPVFHAATINGAKLTGAMHGAVGAKDCYYVAPNAYSPITAGMLNSPDSTMHVELIGGNSMVLHNHKFGKIYLSAPSATNRLSLFTEYSQSLFYSVFAPSLVNLEWTYATNSHIPPTIAYNAPNVESANGKTYYAFHGATKLRTLLFGFPALKKARDAFKNTNLDAASVVRILKALPDLSADTEHLPDLSITNFDDAYYGYRIVTFTTTVSTAAVKKPTAEMWEAYDEAVAKGWLVEGFEGTHP